MSILLLMDNRICSFLRLFQIMLRRLIKCRSLFLLHLVFTRILNDSCLFAQQDLVLGFSLKNHGLLRFIGVLNSWLENLHALIAIFSSFWPNKSLNCWKQIFYFFFFHTEVPLKIFVPSHCSSKNRKLTGSEFFDQLILAMGKKIVVGIFGKYSCKCNVWRC